MKIKLYCGLCILIVYSSATISAFENDTSRRSSSSDAYISWFSTLTSLTAFTSGIAAVAPLINPPNASCIRFLAYNSSGSAENYQVIDVQDPATVPSYFNSNNSVKILVSGFCQKFKCGMAQQVKDAYLQYGNEVNVIVVDYDCMSGYCTCSDSSLDALENTATIALSFHYAVVESPLVCIAIVNFIKFLVDNRVTTFDQIHYIGFSLGVQIGACVGIGLHGQIGRLTGLDPATQALFTGTYDYGLTKGNAQYVDIIHTSAAYLLGMLNRAGDADFYVNGGSNQPDCVNEFCVTALTMTPAPAIAPINYFDMYCSQGKQCVICSHLVSAVYYALSIRTSYLAARCPNSQIAMVTPELCNPNPNSRVKFGANCTTTTKGSFYMPINFNSSTPFNKC